MVQQSHSREERVVPRAVCRVWWCSGGWKLAGWHMRFSLGRVGAIQDASPRGEALFRCARPSGVPRGPATSTGSLKGVQPPLPFGERTRDCSPGHAGKEGPQLARTGASPGFPRAAVPMSQFFASGGQSIEVSASASVLPMNIQG